MKYTITFDIPDQFKDSIKSHKDVLKLYEDTKLGLEYSAIKVIGVKVTND